MPDAKGRIPPILFDVSIPWHEDSEEEAQRESLDEWEGKPKLVVVKTTRIEPPDLAA